MKKAILISTRSEHVANILNGIETIAIRKTKPNCNLPIDVYIYCTKSPGYCYHAFNAFRSSDKRAVIPMQLCNGKVVAKFTLNKIMEIDKYSPNSVDLKGTCITYNKYQEYVGDKKCYAWYIDNLVIFDEPLLLNEHFYNVPSEAAKKWFKENHVGKGVIVQSLLKAPQSWRFVEVDL